MSWMTVQICLHKTVSRNSLHQRGWVDLKRLWSIFGIDKRENEIILMRLYSWGDYMHLLIVHHQMIFLCGTKTYPEEYFHELVLIFLVSRIFLYSVPFYCKLPSLLHSSPACGKCNSELRLTNIDSYKSIYRFHFRKLSLEAFKSNL